MFLHLRRAAPFILVLMISWLSQQSVLPGGVSLPAPWDKVAHGVAFASLGAVTYLGWGDRCRPWVLLLLLVGFGALDEVHQSFVPGRDASFGDWAADAVGSGLGLLAAGRLLSLFRFRTPEAP